MDAVVIVYIILSIVLFISCVGTLIHLQTVQKRRAAMYRETAHRVTGKAVSKKNKHIWVSIGTGNENSGPNAIRYDREHYTKVVYEYSVNGATYKHKVTFKGINTYPKEHVFLYTPGKPERVYLTSSLRYKSRTNRMMFAAVLGFLVIWVSMGWLFDEYFGLFQ
ncbi:MAG: hypothetical protein FWG31_02675 [Oscillospiraceae bacterium]|nr:hypothetical protein [Oscillospiraceae bacterium]